MRLQPAPTAPTVLVGFAGPHGYTLAVWFTTTQAAEAYGLPDLTRSFAFVIGCLGAVLIVGLAATGLRLGDRPARVQPPWSPGAHLALVGATSFLGWAVGRTGSGAVVWLVMGAAVTATYLSVLTVRASRQVPDAAN